MKLVRHFALLLMSAPLFAQLDILTDTKFGMIEDIHYDGYVPNKLYGRTGMNHILTSVDGGTTWQILFGDSEGQINFLKYHVQSNTLNYSVNFNRYMAIKFYDLNSHSMVKTIEVPAHPYSDDETIISYKIFPNDNNYVLVFKQFTIGESLYYEYLKTEDGGQTWTQFYDPYVDIARPTDFEYSPINPNKIFLGYSYENLEEEIEKYGLYVSEDGGNTYSVVLDNIKVRSITTYAHNNSEIWVTPNFYNEGLINDLLRSTDGGETWESVHIDFTQQEDYESIYGIYVNTHNPNQIIITETNEMAFSSDGGNTFQIKQYDFVDWANDYRAGYNVSFNPFNENEFVFRSNFFNSKTSDLGETFQTIRVPYSHTSNVHYVESEQGNILVYGTSYGYVVKNLTTGDYQERDVLQWNQGTSNSWTNFQPDLYQPNKLYIFRGNNAGMKLCVSEDFGLTFTELYETLFFNWSLAYSHPNFPNVVWSSQKKDDTPELVKIDYSNLNNPQIEYINVPEGNLIMGMQINPANTNEMLISTGQFVYKTLDGGNTWNLAMNGIPFVSDDHFTGKILQNPHHEQEYFLVSSFGVYKTSDFGESWTQIYDQTGYSLHLSPLHNGRMVMVTNSSELSKFAIHYTSNGGNSWEVLDNDQLYQLITGYIFNSADVHFQGDEAHVYISTADAGVVKFIINLPELSVSDPIFLNQDHLVIYPNPATDSINISSQSEIEKVEIYSVTGQKVMDSTSAKINVHHLAQGVYVVRAQLKNGKVQTQKFIKK